jgi:hypothetical protein
LLRFFDFVIYTDCDEMLVADPRKHASLAAFLEAVDSDVVSPTGLNVQHIIALEAPIDLNAPILGQRRYVRFASGMCKPSISRVPLLWMPGFHWCDQLSEHRTDLFQFHLRRMDVNISLERLRTTREMAWSEQALLAGGESWRQADEERVRVEFEIPAELARTHGLVPFEFENEMKRRFDSLRLQDGFYKGEHFRGLITEVPETFFGLI